jgi:hypothetical protein
MQQNVSRTTVDATIEDNNTIEISSNHGKIYALTYADGAEGFPYAGLKSQLLLLFKGDILANHQ